MVAKSPFLCVITPVFDGAVKALALLIKALKQQTMTDFIHVVVSAGPSIKCRQFVESLDDSRFIYEECAAHGIDNIKELIASLGERRTYCFKNYDAQRYICLDADLKIISDDYFSQLRQHHNDADILLTKVWWWWAAKKKGPPTVLPKHPFARGGLDLSNFSFSKRIAAHPECFYPTNMGSHGGCDGDWRFFEILMARSGLIRSDNYAIIPVVSAIYNGNNTYTSVLKKIDMAHPRNKL